MTISYSRISHSFTRKRFQEIKCFIHCYDAYNAIPDTFLMNTFYIIVCTYLARFLPAVSIYKTKDPFLFIVNVFNFFLYVP